MQAGSYGGADRVGCVAAYELTVVGSIAFDAVKTPFGARERMLGGAATHFALAASFFDEVRVVGPVGDDFGDAELRVLRDARDEARRRRAGRRRQTFFWAGEYSWDLNSRDTLDTQLGVFETFEPKLSPAPRGRRAVPGQHPARRCSCAVREQCDGARSSPWTR